MVARVLIPSGNFIKNIVIESGYVKGNNYVGSLLGAGGECDLDLGSCSSACEVYGNKYIGGLIGTLSGSLWGLIPNVANCGFTGTVSGYSHVGGLIGEYSSANGIGYSGSYVTGEIFSTTSPIGNFAGRGEFSGSFDIEDSYFNFSGKTYLNGALVTSENVGEKAAGGSGSPT